MLIEINYQAPAANPDGYVVTQRLVREDDIVTVDPVAADANKIVVRIKGSGSQFVQSFTDLTVHESYGSFKSRYSSAAQDARVVYAEAVAVNPEQAN